MVITFKSKAWGDITMMGGDALKLIKLAGHSGTIPGAISADDLPEAIDKLKKIRQELKTDADQKMTVEYDKHILAMKEILTPEQFTRWKNDFEERIKKHSKRHSDNRRKSEKD